MHENNDSKSKAVTSAVVDVTEVGKAKAVIIETATAVSSGKHQQ